MTPTVESHVKHIYLKLEIAYASSSERWHCETSNGLLPAACVEPAAGARVAATGPLHHAAALLARRPEVQPFPDGRKHGRRVGQRARRRLGYAAAVASTSVGRAPVTVAGLRCRAL